MTKNQLNNQTTVKQEISFGVKAAVIASLMLLTAAIIRLLAPPQQAVIESEFVSTNYDRRSSDFQKVFWIGTDITVPEKMSIYQQVGETNLTDYLNNQIIKQYALSPLEKQDNYWLGEEASLGFNSYDKTFVFTLFSDKTSEGPQIIVNEAIQRCLSFYQSYGLDLDLQADVNNIVFVESGHTHGKVSLEEATTVIIPFNYYIGSLKLMQENENNPPFQCNVNNNYEVTKVVYKEKFYQFQPTLELKTISLNQAIDNIQKNKAAIIYATTGQPEIPDMNVIERADLYEVELEYRLDETTKIAYPFYKFKAKLINSEAEEMQAVIITPAMATRQQKN